MARPLRLNLADGWYHVFHRATGRCVLFRDARDRDHFLAFLAEAVERYRVAIHAYVLIDTHFHALIQTSEANLSFAMQWLHVSYAAVGMALKRFERQLTESPKTPPTRQRTVEMLNVEI